MNAHSRPPRGSESAWTLARVAMDALTTGQADTSIRALVTLDMLLADGLEQTPEEELDRC